MACYKKTTKSKSGAKKAKYRIGQVVSVPHDNNKHKVKSKRQDFWGKWHYYVTGISGEFPEDWLGKPKMK